jgi:hypothetical protein
MVSDLDIYRAANLLINRDSFDASMIKISATQAPPRRSRDLNYFPQP